MDKFMLPPKFFDEEPREIRISPRVKRIWGVELDLLFKFAEVCKRHNIPWFIDGGSLLGAARHGGFIPWDDDIDVCMFRNDFEKLERIASTEFMHPYFWQTFKTDLQSARGHATLRNSLTTAIARRNLVNGRTNRIFNQGIFLDIFPLDNIPDATEEAERFLLGVRERISKVRFLVNYPIELKSRKWRVFSSKSGIVDFFKYIRYCISARVRGKNALQLAAEEHENWCKRYNGITTMRACTIAHWPIRKNRQYYRREWFDKTIILNFEMLKVPAPIGYKELLGGLYGNWEEHVISETLHGGLFFDTEHSYKDYLLK